MSQQSISLPLNVRGHIGRECPQCELYFTIAAESGVPDELICPYCEERALQDAFHTPAQVEDARSVVIKVVHEALEAHSDSATSTSHTSISFQNMSAAREKVLTAFGIDLAQHLDRAK